MADVDFENDNETQLPLRRKTTGGTLDYIFSIFGRLWAKDKYEKDIKILERQLDIDRVSQDIRNGDEVVVNETFLSDNVRGRSKLKKGSRFCVTHIHPDGDMFLKAVPESDQNGDADINFDQQAIWIKPKNFIKLDLPVGTEDEILTMENCRVGFTYNVTELTTATSESSQEESKEIVFPPFTELEVIQINQDNTVIVKYSLDEFDEPSFDRDTRFKIEADNFKFLHRTERARLKQARAVREEQLELMEKECEEVGKEIAEQIKKSHLALPQIDEDMDSDEPEVDDKFDRHKPQFTHLEGINFAKFLQSSTHLLDISPAVMLDHPENHQFKVLIKSKPIGINFSFDTPYPSVQDVEETYLKDAGVCPGMLLIAVGATKIKQRTSPEEIFQLLKQAQPPVHFVFEDDDSDIESPDEGELFEKGDKIRVLDSFNGDSIDNQRINAGDTLRVLAIDDGLKVQRVGDPWPRSEWIFEENYGKIQKIPDDERIKNMVDEYLVQMDINYNAKNLEEILEKRTRARLLEWAKGLDLADKRGAILHFVKARDPEEYDEINKMEELEIDELIESFDTDRLKAWQRDEGMISDLWRFPPPRTKDFDRKDLNVIICGESGSGKSTLFNFLCMDHDNDLPDDYFHSDDEEESVSGEAEDDDEDGEESSSEEDELFKTGIVETTTEMRKVTIRKGPLQICLWDSPGWGTNAFKSEEHVRNLGLAHFNVVIICSHSRVKQEEVDLANELYKRKREFMSIRTQLDLEIIKHQGFGKLKKKKKRKSKKAKKSAVEIIRDDFLAKLKEKGVTGHEVYLIGKDSEGNGIGFDYEKLTASLWNHVEMDLYRTVSKATVKGGWSFHQSALHQVRDDAFSLLPVPQQFDLAIYDAREKLAKLNTVNNTGWFILSRLYKFSGLENDEERLLTINVTEYVDDIISHIGNPFAKLQPNNVKGPMENRLMYTILEYAMGNIFFLNATPEDGLKIVPARLSIVHEHKQVLITGKNHCAAGCVAAFWSPKTVEVLTFYNEGKCSIDTVLYYREGVCTHSEIEQIKKGRSVARKLKRIPFFQGEFSIEYFSSEDSERTQSEDVLLSGAFTCARHRINLDERGGLDKYTIKYPHYTTWTEMFSQFLNEKKAGFASFGPNSISYPPGMLDLGLPPMPSEDSLSRFSDEISYDCFTHFDDMMISPDPCAYNFEELEPVRLLKFISGKPVHKPLLQKSGTSSNILLKRALKLLSYAQQSQSNGGGSGKLGDPKKATSSKPGEKGDTRSSIFRSGPSSICETEV